MDNYFSYKRCVELSIIDFIQENVASDWSRITVVKSFLKAYSASLPVISVSILDTDNTRLEIGDNALKQQFTVAVDVFASSDGMRLDLSDYLVNLVKEGCPYYNYSRNSSNREQLDKEQDGRLRLVSFVTDSPVDAYADVPEHDRYRHKLVFIYE